ncbi:class I SAM-dependent methyltransferase [Halosolutus gelatinilyticus]|uniref:class I SAM-dependent methyltransferase n=1 Tax=Halosolutus gelatinilyticus TaxID=2931975 RepID=UPI001FF38629|nr:class I SAM-dependent methyltransferase [Halosolutus gelatinilyticus]
MTDGSDEKRETAASFGAATAEYLASDVHRTGGDLERLAEWCRDAETALDVATGAGHTAGAVAAAAGVRSVVAADASPAMVETAVTEFDGVEGVVADAERLPFDAGSFDAVTCRIAAHHFPDPRAFVASVARVIRPGGTFAFEDNVAPEPTDLGEFIDRVERTRDPTHVESHPTERWCAWLREHGFAVETVEHRKKRLEFEPWVRAQSLDAERRERVERVLLNAPEDARSFFEIRVENGRVRSFANYKALICSTRSA